MIARFLTLVFLTIGLAAATATTASAQAIFCAPRERVVASLTDRYGEAHQASGLQSMSRLVELWVSDKSGTWTLLVTRPDGIACVAASGTHWLEFDPKPAVGDVAG